MFVVYRPPQPLWEGFKVVELATMLALACILFNRQQGSSEEALRQSSSSGRSLPSERMRCSRNPHNHFPLLE
jgi:hypothetical protein